MISSQQQPKKTKRASRKTKNILSLACQQKAECPCIMFRLLHTLFNISSLVFKGFKLKPCPRYWTQSKERTHKQMVSVVQICGHTPVMHGHLLCIEWTWFPTHFTTKYNMTLVKSSHPECLLNRCIDCQLWVNF